jgi:urease accessory protein
MKTRNAMRIAGLVALAVPALAVAHPGHGGDAGFSLGFSHPWGGADHVAVLFAAGLLCARLGWRGAASLLAGLFALFLAAHRDWIAPGAEGWGFVAGFLAASAALVGAGAVASRVHRRLARRRAARR